MSDTTVDPLIDPQDGYVFTWNGNGGTWQVAAPQTQPVYGQNTISNGNTVIVNGTINVPYSLGYIQLDLELEEELKEEESFNGCSCLRCKEFNEYAIPNQDDKTFICYACLHNL